MPKQQRTVKTDKFRGLTNIVAPKRTPLELYHTADNVDIDEQLSYKKRPGYEKVYSGADVNSIKCFNNFCLFNDDGLLTWIDEAFSTGTLGTVANTEEIVYCEYNGSIFFNSFSYNGIITNKAYQVWAAPTQSTVERSYIKVDGSSYTKEYEINSAPALESSIPLGDVMETFYNRIFIGNGTILYFSEPFAPSWFGGMYFQFPSKVVSLMPVSSGMYIATELTLYYLSGLNQESWKLSIIDHIRTVKRSEQLVSSEVVRVENSPLGEQWLITTDKGILVLKDNEFVINLTEDRVTIPFSPSGASGYFQRDGVDRYISILDNNDTDRAVFTDSVSSTVIRNGVELT